MRVLNMTPAILRRVRRLGFFLAAVLSAFGAVAWAQPVINVQPANFAAYETQTATFQVGASGTGPLVYQWRLSGTNLPLGTVSSLVLTNLTSAMAGVYDVVITNNAGSITSAPVTLAVLARPMPLLSFGTYVPGATPQVPVAYTAFGGETNLSFSVVSNPTQLSGPRFVPALPYPNAVVTLGNPTNGVFSLKVTLPPGRGLEPGPVGLGQLEFDALPGATRYGAGIAFTNSPVAVQAVPVNGTNTTPGTLWIDPVLRVLSPTPVPVLDVQSGLFVHRVEVGNPGVITNDTVQLRISGFSLDPLGHPIRVFNAAGTNSNSEWLVYANRIAPGEARALTLEYYVSDLVSAPVPVYAVGLAITNSVANTSQRLVSVDRVQYFTNAVYPSGAFLIEFPTEAGRRYYVQYGPTAEAMVGGTPLLRTSQPAIVGTGSRVQWIDAGPPKTDWQPSETNHFYRIIFGR